MERLLAAATAARVLIAPDVELDGPFPGELQQELVFTSALAADIRQSDAAKALIDYLKPLPQPPSSRQPA